MTRESFKLGDRIVVKAGAYSGREGHVVRITVNGRESGAHVLVRFSGELDRESIFTLQEIRKA